MSDAILDEEKESLFTFATVASSLSFLGCLFIFWTYFAIRDLKKTPAFKMVLHLAIADFALTANGLVNVNAPEVNAEFCEIWGYFREHLALTSTLWPFAFSHAMYCFYTGRYKSQHDLNRVFKYYAIFCWGAPVLLSIIPIFFRAYGSAGIYCWLDVNNPNKKLIFALGMGIFYGPITVLAVMMLFYYVQILRFIARSPQSESKSAVYSLFFYPLVFIITYGFAAGDRFVNLDSAGQVLWLLKAHITLQQAQGFFNAVVYGLSEKVRKQVKQYFSKKKQQEIVKEDEEIFNIPEDLVAHKYGILQEQLTSSSSNTRSTLNSPLVGSLL